MSGKLSYSNLDELRSRLRAMSDKQLTEFRKFAANTCSARIDLGHPPKPMSLIELEEANAEWSRRYSETPDYGIPRDETR